MRVGLERDVAVPVQIVDDALHILPVRAQVAGQPGDRLWAVGGDDSAEDLPAGAGQAEPRHEPIARDQNEAVEPEQVEHEVGHGIAGWRSLRLAHAFTWNQIDITMSIRHCIDSSSLVSCNHRSHRERSRPMIQLRPLDETVPIFQQLAAETSPVILVNVFHVAEADSPALLKAWEDDANWMKKQPGYISTQLHQAIGGSTVFLNYAVWESVAHFRAAFTHPDFKRSLEHYPSSTIASPHLFTRLTVPNLS